MLSLLDGKFIDAIRRTLGLKRDLRDLCREAYGEPFVRQYDILGSGGTIGDFRQTVEFLKKIEQIKKDNEGWWK